ncbi:hypothetical protein GCM10027592_22230 [Spirosoma flavus]
MKTNTIRQFIGLLFLSVHVWAQDVIVKNDKTELNVKVEEITTNTVKYRQFTRLDGPIYNLNKSEVFMIIYKDGTRETFSSPGPVSSLPSVSSYRETTSTTSSSQPTPAPNVSNPPTSVGRGWTYGIGYMTAAEAFGSVHGYTTEGGYYWLLGQRQLTGISLDLGYMDFFQTYSTSCTTFMANSFLRFSPTSKVYIGGGLGYGLVGVPTVDRYGLNKKAYYDGASGKVFMGVGSFRATLVWPSLEAESGSLVTFGLYTNPFK